ARGDLGDEVGGARPGEGQLHVRVLLGEPHAEHAERAAERGRREDGEAFALRARAAPGQREGERHGAGGAHGQPPPHVPSCGASTTTVVALTTAEASEPGVSPSSSTASALMRETTRNGPYWRSTWAMTPSRSTRVTRPVNRLRAEVETPPTSGSRRRSASSWAKRARSAPSRTIRPASSRRASRRPSSTQRRTVSSLTPRSEAAWPIRNCGMSPIVAPQMRLHTQFITATAEDPAGDADAEGTAGGPP